MATYKLYKMSFQTLYCPNFLISPIFLLIKNSFFPKENLKKLNFCKIQLFFDFFSIFSTIS